MKKLLDFFLFPERSNLQLAVWLARFLVIVAIIWFLHAIYSVATVLFILFGQEGNTLFLATVGAQLTKAVQEAFGLALLGLIASHVLVFLIVYLRDNKRAVRQAHPEANGRPLNHE